MPLTTVKVAPGVNGEVTDTMGMGQITSSQLIRFKYASNEVLPEKLGGWSKFYGAAMNSTPRALHGWEGINSDAHLAVGNEESLIVISDGTAEDITPQTFTSTIAPAFSTTNASNIVQIDDTNITVSAFDSIFILTPVAIGGIVLKGAYAIETVLDSDSYTILAVDDATSTAGPGGAVPEFTTIAGSPLVNVDLVNHGYTVGTIFAAAVPTTVGGITIFGAYLVQTVVDADNFTIIAADEAASSDSEFMNSGDAEIIYFIGGAPPAATTGYGIGAYGSGGYGTGSPFFPSTGTPITTTNWTLDNWGEVLIATPANSAVYTWSPDSGFPLAVKIVDAPLINGGSFVAQPAQILVCWGSSIDGVQDPLSIMWSDAGDYTNFTVTSQTQAGGFRIPTGSAIKGGMAGPNFGIIWTDLECWSMDYIEPPLVFGFNTLGANCGLISRHGWAVLNSTVYWMGDSRNFFRLIGETVQTIPCSVWDQVFQNLDEDPESLDHVTVGSNSLFGEIVFYYPSASSGGEVDSYVKFNPDLNVWDYGTLARSAWIDKSPVGDPIGAHPNGFIYEHEISPDDDGQPMLPRFRTGFFQISDGEELTFVDWLIPDFKWGYESGSPDANIEITLYFKDYPNAAVKTAGPFSVSAATEYVNVRLRGRMVAIEVSSSDLGSWWRLGANKIRGTPDGKR